MILNLRKKKEINKSAITLTIVPKNLIYLMTPRQRRELWHVDVGHSCTHAVSNARRKLRPDFGQGIRVVRQIEIQVDVFVLLLEFLVEFVAAGGVIVRCPYDLGHPADGVYSFVGNDLLACRELFQFFPVYFFL